MQALKSQLRRIKRLLRLRGATLEDAEDLVQEAVLRLHAYTQTGGEVRNVEQFMTRTALNLAIDIRRHAHEELYEKTPVEELTSIVDSQPTPDEVLAAEERLNTMREALDSVSLRTREVFFMHRLQGFSHEEIAMRIGISKSAVEKHVASAYICRCCSPRLLRPLR